MLDLDTLLTPLEEPGPCGPDLEYDPVFLQLEAAIRTAGEPPIGILTRSAEQTDWQAVGRLSRSLLLRSKDLRVAICLVRAELRLEGTRALDRSLRLVETLLSRYGDCIHPMPDECDARDITARMSALTALDDHAAVLADLRHMHFGDPAGGVTGRGIELSRRFEPGSDGIPAPTFEDVNLALRQEEQRNPGLLDRLVAADDAVRAIEGWVNKFDYSLGFDGFHRLRSFLSQLVGAVQLALPEATEPPQAVVPAAASAATNPPATAAGLNAAREQRSRFGATLQTERLDPLDIELFLVPVDADAACGPNLEYEPQFLELEAAASPSPEPWLQESALPTAEPDWSAVCAKAQALLGQTKDLRIAMHLLRALTRLGGIPSAVDGLRLIEALLQRYWDEVYPTLDPDDGDPTERVNALHALANPSIYLHDLRSLGFGRPAIAGRAIERLGGDAETAAGESTLTADMVAQSLNAEPERMSMLLQHLRDAARHAESIEAILSKRLGDQKIGLDPLVKLFRRLAVNIEFVLGLRLARTVEEAEDTPSLEPSESLTEEARASRADAVEVLGQIRDWLEQAPFNVSSQCRRAERLADPQFRDVARALVPDRLEQIEEFFGTDEK